jgi:asparagine synthase (glutamine-hydrolysing)
MCGICGIVNFDTSEPVNPAVVRSMTHSLAHRGPDDAGFFIEQNAGLGHRRLSIIDLGGGQQPIFNESGSCVVVFNGEIYNFADLTADLIARGHRFKTRSDTETIIHAYEEHGEECVQQFRGMFTFAVWDRARKRLLLARDRLGIKPLYLYQGSRFLAFASEIKALLEIPGVPRELDPEALDLYLSLRYVPGPRTMFKNIVKLQPGHTLTWEGGRTEIRQYWDGAGALEQFESQLEESVRLRLVAEVPLGVFLSGGLDSSAILALMARARRGERIKTFSVGYQSSTPEEEASNELHYARLAADQFGSEHHEFTLGPEDLSQFLPRMVWLLDEPLADPTCVPLFYLSELARRHITVVLSGEGADEILGGYSIYRRMLHMERAYRRLGPVLTAAGPHLARLAGGEAVSQYLLAAGLPLEDRYRGVCRGFRPLLKQSLLPAAGGSAHLLDDLFHSYFRAVPHAAALDRMLYVDTKVWLPDDLLLKADKMTMAHGLELRVPFLDHKLVEFAARLPGELKMDRRFGKVLLRDAMAGVLPTSILRRPKKGFPIPTASWLRGPLREFARESLLSTDSACRRYMNPSVLLKVVEQNEAQAPDRHQEIWTLLVFEFWHRLFVDRSMSAEFPSGISESSRQRISA